MAPPRSLLVHINDVSLEAFILESIFYGIYTAVFSVTFWSLSFSKPEAGKHRLMTVVTLVMFLLSTAHLGISWFTIRYAFIIHGESYLTTAQYFSASPEWLRVAGATVFAANTLIADCTFIWRCWIIWGRSWKVITLPTLVTLVGTAFSMIALWQKAQPVSTAITSKIIQFGTPYFATSLATTGLVTILIVFRILNMSAPIQTLGPNGHSKNGNKSRYFNVIEVVVESAALYSLALMVFLILFIRNEVSFIYPEQILGVVTGLAPCLIIARVSLGFSRPAESWASGGIVSAPLQFNRPRMRTIIRTSQGDSAHAYPDSVVFRDVDQEELSGQSATSISAEKNTNIPFKESDTEAV